MDIEKWLHETEPLDPNEQASLAPLLALRRSDEVNKGRRRRKHSTSDSSLLQPCPPPRPIPIEEKEDHVHGIADESVCTDDSHPADLSSETSASSDQYARRPRRKTRPERYEPRSRRDKGRGTQLYRQRRDESRKTKPRSKRNKADKPGADSVRRFQAKNISKDRLTLKPREKLGLFNKGKASSPVKGRGLPDLVFSEMKFLQRHKDQPDPVPQPGSLKRKRRKDHAYAKGEEISAYFTTVRPALAKHDVNIQAKEGSFSKSLGRDTGHGRVTSPLTDNAIHTVELPAEKASFLGFGSRGLRHEGDSYVPWSGSIRVPSVAPLRAEAPFATTSGQLDLIHNKLDKGEFGEGNVLHSPAAPPSISRCLLRDSHEQVEPSSFAPANHRLSRSHSCPHQPSHPRPAKLHGRTSKDRQKESCTSVSLMPAATLPRTTQLDQDICIVHDHSTADLPHESLPPKNPKGESKADTVAEEEHEIVGNHEVQDSDFDTGTSSQFDRLVQDCNSAFGRERYQNTTIHRTPRSSFYPILPEENGRMMEGDTLFPTVRRLPTVRFPGVEEHRTPMPSYGGLNIYEAQERREQAVRRPGLYHDIFEPEYYGQTDGYLDEPDETDEMTFDEQGLATSLPENGTTRDWHQVVALGDLETQEDEYEQQAGVERRAGDYQEEKCVVIGFWRPNKLY